MTDKNKRHYWAVRNRDEILFTGTFNECWEELIKRFYNLTVGQLELAGVRISRSQ